MAFVIQHSAESQWFIDIATTLSLVAFVCLLIALGNWPRPKP